MRIRRLATVMIRIAASRASYGALEPITVVIFDYAGTPGPTLKKASETAQTMFRMAGLETNWVVCRPVKNLVEPCLLPPAGSYLEARITPNWADSREKHEAMGFALSVNGERTAISYALYAPTKAFANRAGQSVTVVLACVMAHEIGHLMGLKHGLSGIMKAEFEPRDMLQAAMSQLDFNTEEARVLRALAESRVNPAAPGAR
jgi:hypothetical protein